MFDFRVADNAPVPHVAIVRVIEGAEITVAQFYIMPEQGLTVWVLSELAEQIAKSWNN